MPLGDGTGPMGWGPMTGRAAGYCAGFPVPGYMNPVPGRVGYLGPYAPVSGPYGYGVPYGSYPAWGFGRRLGRGFGRGLGWGRGRGRGWGRRYW